MTQPFQEAGNLPAIAVQLVTKAALEEEPDRVRNWAASVGFDGKAGERCFVPGDGGTLEKILVGVDDGGGGLYALSELADSLPAGLYRLTEENGAEVATKLAVGWALGRYRFDRYKKKDAAEAVLEWPKGADRPQVERIAQATTLVRDLINTPAEHMGPSELANAAEALAKAHGASYSVIVGNDLLTANYPAIHAVGRASDDPPRLIDIIWGDAEAPKVTLVGKGVCFDTGGLDIKAAAGMKLMKKDMGGAAHVLGIAKMIMMAALPVRLRVLVPAVENSIAGNAIRPLDVVSTRKGITVEIGNTDAEGRVILADALAEADTEEPAIIVDFATLTGAARVALGPELPALFCDDDGFAARLLEAGKAAEDPLWRMPLWPGYRKMIDGKVADITNAPEGAFGGAITAALFLKEFVEAAPVWAHIDVMAWNSNARPGRPEGGEAMGMRAVFDAVAAAVEEL